jgi:hypothetical protein
MALQAAWTTGRRVYANPTETRTSATWTGYQGRYDFLWSRAQNSAFEDLAAWASYRGNYALYPQIRSLYNPFGRLVQFYASQVYPGSVAVGDARLPEGVRNAFPLADGTDPRLEAALLQNLQWSNWGSRKRTYVEFGATLGEVFMEIVDDVDAGKVAMKVRWPGLLDALTVDDYGNVKAYALKYTYFDTVDEQTHEFKKVVTPESIATFRDDSPYSYVDGVPPEYANPYGFCPAVWAQHNDYGTDHGTPCLRSGFGPIDELNSLASRMLDYLTLQSKSPIALATDGTATNISSEAGASGRDEMFILKVPADASSFTLAGNLKPDDAIPHMKELITEIERSHPELSMYAELRSMSAITGPAADRLLGDVREFVGGAAANYDMHLLKATQMTTAIGGMRVGDGSWGAGPLTPAQEKFRPFSLDSYAQGNLDYALLPRPLVPVTETETWANETARAGATKAWIDAGLPPELAMAQTGFTEEQIAEITLKKTAAIDRMQRLAQSDDLPEEDQ